MTKKKIIALIALTVFLLVLVISIMTVITVKEIQKNELQNYGFVMDENGKEISSEEVVPLPSRLMFANPNPLSGVNPTYRTLQFNVAITPSNAYYHAFSPYYSYDGTTWTKYTDGALSEFTFTWDNETRILTVQCLEAFDKAVYVAVGLANEDLNNAYYTYSKCKLDCLSYPYSATLKLNEFISFPDGGNHQPFTIYNDYYGDRNACFPKGDFTDWSYTLRYTKGSITDDIISNVGLYVRLNPQWRDYAVMNASFDQPLPLSITEYSLDNLENPSSRERLKMSSNFYTEFFGFDPLSMKNVNSLNALCAGSPSEVFKIGVSFLSKNYGILTNENHDSTPARISFEFLLFCDGIYNPVKNIGIPDSGIVGY